MTEEEISLIINFIHLRDVLQEAASLWVILFCVSNSNDPGLKNLNPLSQSWDSALGTPCILSSDLMAYPGPPHNLGSLLLGDPTDILSSYHSPYQPWFIKQLDPFSYYTTWLALFRGSEMFTTLSSNNKSI